MKLTESKNVMIFVLWKGYNQISNSLTDIMYHYLPGMGIPPNIRMINTTTIIPAIISGTSSLKNASATTAIAAITRSVSIDPWYGTIVTKTDRTSRMAASVIYS